MVRNNQKSSFIHNLKFILECILMGSAMKKVAQIRKAKSNCQHHLQQNVLIPEKIESRAHKDSSFYQKQRRKMKQPVHISPQIRIKWRIILIEGVVLYTGHHFPLWLDMKNIKGGEKENDASKQEEVSKNYWKLITKWQISLKTPVWRSVNQICVFGVDEPTN